MIYGLECVLIDVSFSATKASYRGTSLIEEATALE
jgi:hypothetical protein